MTNYFLVEDFREAGEGGTNILNLSYAGTVFCRTQQSLDGAPDDHRKSENGLCHFST